MTEFAHAVNFTISFGVTVLPKDINKLKENLQNDDYEDCYMHYDIHLTKNSTDEEIANYLGLQNYRNWALSECVDMEMEDHHVYDAKDTERLTREYKRKVQDFKEANTTSGVNGK